MKNQNLDGLVSEIESFDESSFGAELTEAEPEKKLILFIGDSPYSPNTATNVAPFGEYIKYGFREVAFLCNKKTLDMYSIMSVLMGSMDDASYVLSALAKHKKIDNLARYLLYRKNVMLVNARTPSSKNKMKFVFCSSQIDKLLLAHKNHLVFFCPSKSKVKLSAFPLLDVKGPNGKRDFVFAANHPSSNSYRKGFWNNCETYLERSYQDPGSNLSLTDFKVF